MGLSTDTPDVVRILMSLLVCFAGQIGSGKSSVSQAVAGRLGWRRTGFGDYVRAELAAAGGDPASREQLQELGQRLVAEDAEGFCRNVLAAGDFRAGQHFVLDGVRHAAILQILQRLVLPSVTRLLFLSADVEHLKQRVALRSDAADLARAHSHAVEFEVTNRLPAQADVIVDAEQPFESVVEECCRKMVEWATQES